MKKLSVLLVVIYFSLSAFAKDGDLENQFYFRFGLSKPSKAYIGVDDKSYWDETKRIGGVFELGSIFMLNSIPLTDGMRLGINADFVELTYHQLTYDDNTALRLFSIASKFGPSFSYSPVKDLVFDATFKMKIQWLSGMLINYSNSSPEDEVYGGALGLGFATGFNLRYKFLMLGFEFNKVNMRLIDSEDSDKYAPNISDPGSKRTPLPYWNIMLGFSF